MLAYNGKIQQCHFRLLYRACVSAILEISGKNLIQSLIVLFWTFVTGQLSGDQCFVQILFVLVFEYMYN